jgi:hypothetical protein
MTSPAAAEPRDPSDSDPPETTEGEHADETDDSPGAAIVRDEPVPEPNEPG